MTETPPPSGLAVYWSWPKLALGTLVMAPFLAALPFALLLAAIKLVAGHGGEVLNASWFVLLLTAASAMLWRFIATLWRSCGMAHVAMILLPEGFVMPSLGSNKPIPWENVDAFTTTGVRGGTRYHLHLKVDQQIYPYVFGMKPFLRSERKTSIVWSTLPAFFNVGRGDIVEQVQQFRAWKEAISGKPLAPMGVRKLQEMLDPQLWKKIVRLALGGPIGLLAFAYVRHEPLVEIVTAVVLLHAAVILAWIRRNMDWPDQDGAAHPSSASGA